MNFGQQRVHGQGQPRDADRCGDPPKTARILRTLRLSSRGLFRFRDLPEATRKLETVAADYDRQSRLARSLAEEYFDARKNLAVVLERALN